MYDADDLGRVTNEFLVTPFVPGVCLFAALWAAFRLWFDAPLRSHGLPPVVPASGAGAVAAGHGRFPLLIALTTVLLLPRVGLYARFVRGSLRDRVVV